MKQSATHSLVAYDSLGFRVYLNLRSRTRNLSSSSQIPPLLASSDSPARAALDTASEAAVDFRLAEPPRALPLLGKGTNSGRLPPSQPLYRDRAAVMSSHTTCHHPFRLQVSSSGAHFYNIKLAAQSLQRGCATPGHMCRPHLLQKSRKIPSCLDCGITVCMINAGDRAKSAGPSSTTCRLMRARYYAVMHAHIGLELR